MKVVSCGSAKGGVGKSTLTMILTMMWRHRHSMTVLDLNLIPQSYCWADALGIKAIHCPDITITALRQLLKSLNTDIVVIDFPPANSEAIGASIAFSNVVVLPFHPSSWEICGIELLIQVIELTIRRRARPPAVICVPYRADPRHREARFDVSSLPFDVLYAPPIHSRVEIQRAASAHTDLFTAFPFTKAEREILTCSKFVLTHLISADREELR